MYRSRKDLGKKTDSVARISIFKNAQKWCISQRGIFAQLIDADTASYISICWRMLFALCEQRVATPLRTLIRTRANECIYTEWRGKASKSSQSCARAKVRARGRPHMIYGASFLIDIHNSPSPIRFREPAASGRMALFPLAIHKRLRARQHGNDFIRCRASARALEKRAPRRQELIDFSLLWAPGSHANIELKAQGSLKHFLPPLFRYRDSFQVIRLGHEGEDEKQRQTGRRWCWLKKKRTKIREAEREGKQGRRKEKDRKSTTPRVGFRFSFRVSPFHLRHPRTIASSHVQELRLYCLPVVRISLFLISLSRCPLISPFIRFVFCPVLLSSQFSPRSSSRVFYCERETFERAQHASNETFRLRRNENRKWQRGILN